jgi:cytochrome c553
MHARLFLIMVVGTAAALGLGACGPAKAPAGASLAWAYPKAAKQPFGPTAPGPKQLPGSTLTFTAAQVADDENPVDWFPGEHPPAPAIVAHQPAGGPTPCAECHQFNGKGFLGAPDLAGLPAAYIVQQIEEFRSGRRLSWEHGRPATAEMVEVAKKVTDADLASAAAYFAALPRPPRFRVAEADKAPATRPNYYGWLDLAPGGAAQPTQGRVIEVAEDFDRMVLGDDHVGVVDYAAPGAVARGEALVHAGGRGGQPCAACHGADLRGMGETPALAGRSAAYLARMLWDIKTGARQGPAVTPMLAPTAHLEEADIADVTAYLASLKP